jgi:AGCS family alanine or glycine:cation symporter
MDIQPVVSFLNSIIWSTPLIALCLLAGVYFSIRTRFMQVRLIKDMISLLFSGGSSKAGISSFQGFAMALGGRVGTGNIAGVATAIAMGGPGALFWMWVIAFLGAGSAFAEAALAQLWKEKIDGVYCGGPAYYIEKGLKNKVFSKVFAITTVISCGLFLPGVQSNSISAAVFKAFPAITPTISGFAVIFLMAIIIFGGVKRIGKVAQMLVPFMAIIYIIVTIVIVGINIEKIPAIFALIISSAVGGHSVFGGIVGSAIAWGVKRGIYSNEAGQGTAPQAAAAAEVNHPAEQGIVQAFSVYVDTLLVCTATGFMLLMTNMYNVFDKGGEAIANNIPNVEYGPQWTQKAIDSVFPGFGSPFIAVALFFFSFTTLMAYAYYAESNTAYLFRKNSKIAVAIVRILLLVMTFGGSLRTVKLAWDIGDIGVGLMAWLNIVAILLLSNKAIALLKDYEKKKKSGQEMSFKAGDINVDNASQW